jgi:hypothetical protein
MHDLNTIERKERLRLVEIKILVTEKVETGVRLLFKRQADDGKLMIVARS